MTMPVSMVQGQELMIAEVRQLLAKTLRMMGPQSLAPGQNSRGPG
jgi:hypothetical protein